MGEGRHCSCVGHTSPGFPKRKLCEAQSEDDADCPGHRGEWQRDGPTLATFCSEAVLLAWCWGGGQDLSHHSSWYPGDFRWTIQRRLPLPESSGERHSAPVTFSLLLQASWLAMALSLSTPSVLVQALFSSCGHRTRVPIDLLAVSQHSQLLEPVLGAWPCGSYNTSVWFSRLAGQSLLL